MIDVVGILVHWHAGRSLSEVSQSLGVDRKTIRKYIAPAVSAGIVAGGSAKSEQEWHDLVREWFPELADTRLRQARRSTRRTRPTHYERVPHRCPRTAINSQRSPPAATCAHEAGAGFEPASNGWEHPRNA